MPLPDGYTAHAWSRYSGEAAPRSHNRPSRVPALIEQLRAVATEEAADCGTGANKRLPLRALAHELEAWPERLEEQEREDAREAAL